MDEPIANEIALEQARRKKIDEKQGLLALLAATLCTGAVALGVVPDIVAPTFWLVLLAALPFALNVTAWWRFKTQRVLIEPQTSYVTPLWRRVVSCVGLMGNSLVIVVLWEHMLVSYSPTAWPFAQANVHEWTPLKSGCVVLCVISLLAALVGESRSRFPLVLASLVVGVLWVSSGVAIF